MLLALCAMLFAPCAFSQTVTTGPASNVTRISAIVYGTITATNGTTNAITARLFYGTSDATNSFSWASSNVLASYTGAVPYTVTNAMTGLTPAQTYYYRWHVIQGSNSAWASATSNFWTTSGAPTSTPPAAPYIPVMLDAGSLKSVNWDPIIGPYSLLIGYNLSSTNLGLYPWGAYMFLEGGPGTYIGDQSSGAGIVGKRLSGSAVINDFSAGALIRGQMRGNMLISGAPAADQVGDFSGTAHIYGSSYVSGCHQWLYQAAGLAVINGAWGAWQIGYQASGVMTNLAGHASIQIMSGSGTNVMTGKASIGIGSTTVTHDRALVIGTGMKSIANESATIPGGICLWYQDTTNYSYITMSAGKFIMNGVSNGTLYAVTNSIY